MNELEVVLTEYKALRDELRDKFRFHLQIYSIFISSLLIVYGLIFSNKTYDLLMAIPIFSFAIFLRFLMEQESIHKISNYIEAEIEEKKIPMLIGKINKEQEGEFIYTNLWMGWQHFWKETPHTRFFRHSSLLIFLGISVLPALFYSAYNILCNLLGMLAVTKLPMIINVIFLVFNFLLAYYMALKFIHLGRKVLPNEYLARIVKTRR